MVEDVAAARGSSPRLPSGGRASVIVRARVLNSAAGSSVANLATVSGDQPDPDLSNNQATATTRVPPSVNLRVTKTASTTDPNPWALHNVKVCDRLPPGTMFVVGSNGVRDHGRLVCWTIATLRPHASKSVLVKAETLLGVTGTLRDAATATGTAAGRRLTAHARAHVLVAPTGLCGSASAVPDLRTLAGPLAVIAC